ncbi:MAG TPA: YqgE/AlgH family protein [Rhizomicrobium sp.]|nr:YqgE/AlgH family protein [Rhizomicrobium sp.]
MASLDSPHGRNSDGFLTGKLLIAMPGMPDARFERSVIFICSHSADGALGLIVNKPLEGLPFRELMSTMKIPVTDATPSVPVMFGGPMETDRGYVLHSNESRNVQASMSVTSEISLTPTVDILRSIARGTGPQKFLFALGYAGWGPGQIEDEIAGNGWIHCDADADIIFRGDAAAKWQLALAKLGANVSGLSSDVGHA